MAETMYALVKKTCMDYPKAKAIRFLGKEVLYRDLFKNIDAVAANLYKMGLRKGDTITIALPNMPTAAYCFYAANKIGIRANIVHPLVPPGQLVSYMDKTKSRIAFVLDTAFSGLKDLFAKQDYTAVICSPKDDLPSVTALLYALKTRKNAYRKVFGDRILSFKSLLQPVQADIPVHEDDKACSIYLHSGGTTGVPKTIMLNDSALNSLALRGKYIIGCDDPVGKGMLAILPIFHGFGLCMCMHTMFVNGCVSVMLPNFNAKAAIRSIRRGDVHLIAGVPTMYEKLISRKGFSGKHLKNLEFAFCGGDSMPLTLKKQFDDLIASQGGTCKMMEGYGLTEVVTVCCVNLYNACRNGSVGKPLSGMRAKVIDPATGADLSSREEGEIAICSDTEMLGYLDDEVETRRVMTQDETGNTWVRTGDFGHIDEDGYVFFKQRLKRIIKVSGVAVFPTEIEECAQGLPFIKRVAAIGVKNAKTGHSVRLFVQLQDGVKEDREILKEKLAAHLKERLIAWAVPRDIRFTDDLPLTQIGKVDVLKLESEQEDASDQF